MIRIEQLTYRYPGAEKDAIHIPFPADSGRHIQPGHW